MPARVLLIEDDAVMLSLLHTLLSMEGYEALQMQEENLEGMLRSIQQEKPDVVLMDVNLRGADGFDLLRCIRQEKGLEGVRVLMTSGMDFGGRCEEEGADGFILKPYMPEELIRQIRHLVEAGTK
jgi:DNA-binding response OmpR family regulator